MHKIFIILFLLLATAFISGCSNKPKLTDLPTRLETIPTSSAKMTPTKDKLPPILHSNQWHKPVPLAKEVNSAGGEDSAFIMPNGNTLYFFFTPNVKIPAQKQVLDKVTGIYVSKKIDGKWTEAKRVMLQKNKKLALDGCGFVQNGYIWFCSAREGYTGLHWFKAELGENQHRNWQVIEGKFTDYQVGELHINSTGNRLYFHSDRPGGAGQYDIWVSEKQNDIWQQPVNIKIINSPETDGWPFVNEDETQIWFTRTYKGSPAIFRSVKKDGQWQKPELILSQFAGESSLDNSGNIYFTHHYYNNDGMIEADIYVAYKK